MLSNIDSRLNFENAVKFAARLGYTVGEAQCTQSYIRTEVPMNAASTNYTLPLIVNQQNNTGTVRVLNNLLNMQDIFLVNSVLVGWTVAASTSGVGKVYTYPNPTGATSTPIATALNALYNGKLSLMNNNQNVVPAWDLNRHLFVPRTQENTNFNSASATAPAQYTIDQLNLSEDGFVPVEPNWAINGGGNIVASITLPAAISSIPTNGAIVAIFRGILLSNVSSVK